MTDKTDVILSTIHGLGVDIDNMLESSLKAEQHHSGCSAAISSLRDEIKLCGLDESAKNLVLGMLDRHAAKYKENFIHQKGVSKSLENVVRHVKSKFDEVKIKKNSENIGKRPDPEARSQEVAARKKRNISSK
jgi:hypothetical protein